MQSMSKEHVHHLHRAGIEHSQVAQEYTGVEIHSKQN